MAKLPTKRLAARLGGQDAADYDRLVGAAGEAARPSVHAKNTTMELNMQIAKYGLVAAILMAAGLSSAMAQLELSGDTLDNCSEIDALRKAGNYTAARDKAQLCLDALESAVSGEVGKSFPAEVGGWTRTSLDEAQALGFTNITATYANGEHTAEVALTGGAGGDSLGGLLSGFARAGLAQAGRQVRVGGLPGTVQSDGTITVTLEDGSFLTFQSASFGDADAALAGIGDLVNAFPVAEINQKLK